MSLPLPMPSADAKDHSMRLQSVLKQLIKQQNKISFHDYMQRALYEPGLGYYSAGSCKLGAAGDFITAPEISPLFGASIAKQFVAVTRFLNQCDWLELGAGTGSLARAILLQLCAEDALPEQYYILEVSADLKQRQQQMLQATLPPEIFSKIVWLSTLPEKFEGIIIANEVLDALPVHRFRINDEGVVQEMYIDIDEQNNLIELFDVPSSNYLAQRIGQLNLSPLYVSEINLQQEALLKSLNDCLTKGVMVFIDYGFPEKEFYHPDRTQGTLMCHYQHHAHGDALFWPGLQDITAHVDFTALARCAIESGLSLINFSTQSAWLLHAGILDLAEKQQAMLSDREQLLVKQAIHKLIAAEEMGELFKCIVFGKSMDDLVINTTLLDMRHRL